MEGGMEQSSFSLHFHQTTKWAINSRLLENCPRCKCFNDAWLAVFQDWKTQFWTQDLFGSATRTIFTTLTICCLRLVAGLASKSGFMEGRWLLAKETRSSSVV